MYGTVMLLAGLLVWFGLRNQDVHATPSAVLLACVASAIASALLGWYLAPAYVIWRKRTAHFFVPFAILICAALIASVSYVLATPAMRDWEFVSFVSAQANYIPSYVLWYLASGSFVWVPGLVSATLVLARVSVRANHS
jgi:hypothetical protein